MPSMLVVEDDPIIGPSLVRLLIGAGHDAMLASTAATARASVTPDTDIVLLDLGLPDGDGVALCGELRELAPGATIVMLTARASEIDVVMGLDAGADDYVVKPFRPAELLARIRAHLRRATTDDAAGPYAVGALTLDLDERRASWDGVELVLRPKEFDLLHALVRQAGHAVTREALMADVWDPNWFGSTKTLDVHVSSLRRKIADAGGTLALTTLRGVGFRLERS